MKKGTTGKEKAAGYVYYMLRIGALMSALLMFLPALNPARICDYVNKNMSLLTSAISYSELVKNCIRAFNQGWVQKSSFILLSGASIVTCLGIIATAVTACMSAGNLKMKKTGNWFAIAGGIVEILGLMGIYLAYTQVAATSRPEKVLPSFEQGDWLLFLIIAILTTLSALIVQILLPKPEKTDKFEMESKYKLFLMFLPFAVLAFAFSYLPLYGWRYAFYDYTAGGTLSSENFVGFKWFTTLIANETTRNDVIRVLRNTLAMSGLGILTSWLPLAFAIFLSEIKNMRVRRFIQTFTTIPNFISWVLVYAIALAIFSTDGFISSVLVNAGVWAEGKNMLMGSSHIWLKMLAWGTWKGIGWSAIIYIAGISGIDQQLYEAATVDGAGRFQKMWHITVPGLIPTYMVLLLMSVAGVLSNGMDQYLNFQNAQNSNYIQVLDLYVYQLGIDSGSIPLSTVIGMVKSLVSVILLFGANGISKLIRGESIV